MLMKHTRPRIPLLKTLQVTIPYRVNIEVNVVTLLPGSALVPSLSPFLLLSSLFHPHGHPGLLMFSNHVAHIPALGPYLYCAGNGLPQEVP